MYLNSTNDVPDYRTTQTKSMVCSQTSEFPVLRVPEVHKLSLGTRNKSENFMSY